MFKYLGFRDVSLLLSTLTFLTLNYEHFGITLTVFINDELNV